MRHVILEAELGDVESRAAFLRICDFERYPALTEAVHSVRVEGGPGHELRSHWEVSFRNGILRWTESDRLDHDNLTIAFEQVTGDFARFSGVWQVRRDDATVLRFDARFDMGIPSLASIVDPLAERAMVENVGEIIRGLFPDAGDVVRRAADLTALRGGC